MNTFTCMTVGLFFVLTPPCYAQSGEMPRRPQTLRLANMQAMLFFENTGKFSPDVFTNQVNLWNTPSASALGDVARFFRVRKADD